MCGIVGIVESPGREPARALVSSMNAAMRARGPDGSGEFREANVAMAMRRLAVIDLETGDQPCYARDATIVAFQNGEIYNFRELRRELESRGCAFTTQGDTEVLAHGFAVWGMEGLLRRLDGMFGIAIFDRAERCVWLARDRFGEKPLFYTAGNGRAAWSSSLSALALLPGLSLEIDPTALDQYLALHFVPGRCTIFRDVQRVMPGEYLRIDADTLGIRAARYHRLALGETRERSGDELEELLRRSVRSRLVADVPVGVFLSGGLDSSLIAALAIQEAGALDTFSMGFHTQKHDESAFARQVADHIGSRHHHCQFDEDSFRALLPEVAHALDEPLGDPAMLPLYWLCREARRHVTVALSGEGADEVFGGYAYYRFRAPALNLRERWLRRRRRHRIETAPLRLTEHDSAITPSGYPVMLERTRRRALLEADPDPEPSDSESELFSILDEAHNDLQRASAADLLAWLPDDLLVKFDRMSMAHSLEGRAPYLQPDVVQAGLELPPQRRATWKLRKRALVEVGDRILPPNIASRRKHGFVLPMRRWLVNWFDEHGGVEGWLEQRALPHLDRMAIAKFVEADLDDGAPSERFLFALVLLLEWYHSFLERVERGRRAA